MNRCTFENSKKSPNDWCESFFFLITHGPRCSSGMSGTMVVGMVADVSSGSPVALRSSKSSSVVVAKRAVSWALTTRDTHCKNDNEGSLSAARIAGSSGGGAGGGEDIAVGV